MRAFPQVRKAPVVLATLTTGHACALLDAVIDVWAPERINVRASAAIVGNAFPESDQADISTAELQFTALDAVAGVAPIKQIAWPMDQDGEAVYSITRNADANLRWIDSHGAMEFSFVSSINVGDGYGHRFDFSPILKIALNQTLSFDALRVKWLLPLSRIAQLATGRVENVTWLQVQGGDQLGRPCVWQVFAPWITQGVFVSESRDVRQRESSLALKYDGDSLLAILSCWQQQESATHPLIETFARDLRWLIDQPPRAQVLTLLQAIEGWYAHEHAGEEAARRDRHITDRDEVISELESHAITRSARRFLRSHLSKSPWNNLERPLRWAGTQLPGSLDSTMASLSIVQSLIAQGDAQDWASALRVIRNDLSHGNRAYPVRELADLAAPLLRYTRAATLQVIGACAAAQNRAVTTIHT